MFGGGIYTKMSLYMVLHSRETLVGSKYTDPDATSPMTTTERSQIYNKNPKRPSNNSENSMDNLQ